jgi:hypothetical protein
MSKKILDLSLMKKLIAELETTMTEADKLRSLVETVKHEINTDIKTNCIIELNKALGLTAGILTEAGMLMGDLQHQMHGVPSGSGGPGGSDKEDFMKKILGGLGGQGSAGGLGGSGTAN